VVIKVPGSGWEQIEEKGKEKATEVGMVKGKGKGKGNSKGKGSGKNTPGGDDISCAIALQLQKAMSEAYLDTEV